MDPEFHQILAIHHKNLEQGPSLYGMAPCIDISSYKAWALLVNKHDDKQFSPEEVLCPATMAHLPAGDLHMPSSILG